MVEVFQKCNKCFIHSVDNSASCKSGELKTSSFTLATFSKFTLKFSYALLKAIRHLFVFTSSCLFPAEGDEQKIPTKTAD